MGEQLGQRETADRRQVQARAVASFSCRLVHLQAHQAVGRSPRARRVGGELLGAGQPQPEHGPILGGRQGDRLQVEVEPGQSFRDLFVEAGHHLVDRFGNLAVQLIAGANAPPSCCVSSRDLALQILALATGRCCEPSNRPTGLRRNRSPARSDCCTRVFPPRPRPERRSAPTRIAQKQLPHDELRLAVVIEGGRSAGGGRVGHHHALRASSPQPQAVADRAPRGPSSG